MTGKNKLPQDLDFPGIASEDREREYRQIYYMRQHHFSFYYIMSCDIVIHMPVTVSPAPENILETPHIYDRLLTCDQGPGLGV